jgi:hypothetical protein
MEPLRGAREETRRLSSIVRHLIVKVMGVGCHQHMIPDRKTMKGSVGQHLACTDIQPQAGGTSSPGLDQNGVVKMRMLWELGRCLS